MHLASLKCVPPRPRGNIFTLNLHELRNDMPSKARLEYFWNFSYENYQILQKGFTFSGQ